MTLFLALVYALFFAMLVANVWYLRRRPRIAPESPPSVSILIPARDEENNLRRLLPSLLEQTYPDFTIAVYDDQSTDETWSVLESFDDPRLVAHRGGTLPEGWVGKVHGLYRLTRQAQSDLYLFLDADAEMKDPEALRRLVEYHEGCAGNAVMTGLTHLKSRGALLVSLVPLAILTGIPWPLLPHLNLSFLSGLNGQCWMIDAYLYHMHEPHRRHPDEVLEDVVIGRYLKSKGVTPYIIDAQDEVAVHMYDSLGDAWRGFRKNMYLVMGGSFLRSSLFFLAFLLTYVAAPLFSLWFLPALYLLKICSDRMTRFSPLVSLLMPVSFLLGGLLQIDSAVHHLMGRASWKGRVVSKSARRGDRNARNEVLTS